MSASASARETAFTGELELRFPFNEQLKEALKEAIPRRYLRWDPEEKVWRVTEPHQAAAIALLLEYFPSAQVPDTYARRVAPEVTPAADDGPPWEEEPWWDTPARPAPKPAPKPTPKGEPVVVVPPPAPTSDDLAPLVAVVPCPKCGDQREQPVRVVAETSTTVARQERPPAEMLSVCERCRTLAVVAFFPAVASAVVS
jgi:hypothetical protein